MNEITPVARASGVEALRAEILEKLTYAMGKDPIVARDYDWLSATILAVRDRAIDRWMDSTRRAYRTGAKRVYYFSLEFLIGRLLRDTMSNLGMVDDVRGALSAHGVYLDKIEH